MSTLWLIHLMLSIYLTLQPQPVDDFVYMAPGESEFDHCMIVIWPWLEDANEAEIERWVREEKQSRR